MTDIALAIAGLAEREQILILRSALHVVPDESALPEWARFHNKVTELDAARLIHAVERGAVVVSQGDTIWTDLGGGLRARMRHLTRVVEECLRLHLVSRTSKEIAPAVWRTWLVTAPVHLRTGANWPACDQSYRERWRFRLTDDSGLIDCKACLVLDQ